MRRFVGDRPVLIFFILAVGIALIAMAIRATDPQALGAALQEMFQNNQLANIITGVQASIKTPVLWNAILFPAAPTLAAFVVIAIAYGPGGLRAWAARLAPWRGISWQRGVTIWLLYLAVFVAAVGIYFSYLASTGDTQTIAAIVERIGPGFPTVVAGFAIMILLSSGPLLEEMGWRGFLLPLLLHRMSPLAASVLIGVLWSLWHLPREIGPLMSGKEGIWAAVTFKQLEMVIGSIALSIIATFLVLKLGGSVWGGIFAHAFHNELAVNVIRTGEPVISILGIPLRSLTVVEIGIAIIIVVLAGRSLGAPQDDRQAPHPFARR